MKDEELAILDYMFYECAINKTNFLKDTLKM
jgi:hypothetical protein